MQRKEYSAGGVKLSFWFMEFRKMVQLLADGNTLDEIRSLSQNENIFAAPTIVRSNQIYNTVSARVETLDKSFYSVFLNGDLATQKIFVLIASMSHDTMFFDFVYEVIREKMIIGSNEYTDSDVRIFFKEKQQQNERVAKWTDYTCKRLGSYYKTMLYEARMTNNAKDVRTIFKPILDPEMEHWLINQNMEIMIKALTGVR